MGSPRQMFKKKVLAASVAALASVSYSAVAQDAPVEEVLVTGIRASLENAMDIKRDSSGVVDAISAEDIGKMPDANLAESLQRITGVSISRTNGEGSQVTVRGIDPSMNMVTLNGRNMPAVNNDGNAGDTATRAFDFNNLASEVVNGVEVYKTGNAAITTGGLGAVINIKTLRPLDAGSKATVGAKLVHDTTVENGDDVTPEVSGLYSWVDDDSVFGVAVAASYQGRDNSRSNAFVTEWRETTWEDENLAHLLPYLEPEAARENNPVVNAPSGNTIFYTPSDIRYVSEDNSRTRTNAQLTLQYSPVDSLTATLDYTFAENELEAERAQQSTWYNLSAITAIEFNRNEIPSPAVYQETYPGGDDVWKDVSFAQQDFNGKTTMNSLGVNLEWQASDSLSFVFDAHNSVAENIATRKEIGLNANIVTGNYGDFRADLPVMGITIDDSSLANGNNNGRLDGGDISGSMGTIVYAEQETEITQARIGGEFIFSNDAKLNFGLEFREDNNLTKVDDGAATGRITMGNWGGVDPDVFGGEWPGLFTSKDFADVYPDYDITTTDDNFLAMGLDVDYDAAASILEQVYASGVDPDNFSNFPGGKIQPNSAVTGIYNVNREITEEVTSAFAQYFTEFDLGEMPASLQLGLRVEQTEVTSTSVVNIPLALRWDDSDDFSQVLSTEVQETAREGDYTNVLPNVDFSVNPTEDVKVRFGLSKTMARAGYADLRGDVAINNIQSLTANAGNPNLEPMESINFDLSTEWYYDDASYMSVGIFNKKVSNFIGSDIEVSDWYGLRDPRTGERYADAVADLQNAGTANPTTLQIFNQMLVNEGKDPADESTFIQGNDTDQLAYWGTTIPVNDQDNEITGLELAIQHWFGDSGFGVQANYTTVDSDVKFDVSRRGGQFAMVGLSDSANLVAFYDDNGIQARVAYNWRDAFLDNRTQFNTEPSFTEAYSQIDASVSYEINDSLTVSAEGLNITGENSRRHGRTRDMLWSLEDLGARYNVGVRYTF